MKEKEVKVNQIRRYKNKIDAYEGYDTFIIIEIYGSEDDRCCKLKILGNNQIEIATPSFIQNYTVLISEAW